MCNKPLLSVLALAGAMASFSVLAQVTPPPRPPGSARAQPQTGQNDDESRRMLRAHKHHHRFHFRKDVTRDDSDDDHDHDSRGAKRQDDRNERRNGR